MRQSTLRALGEQGKNRFKFQALRRHGLSFAAGGTLTVDQIEPEPFVLGIIRDMTMTSPNISTERFSMKQSDTALLRDVLFPENFKPI